MGLIDGDTTGLGTLIDNMILFIANVFIGLAGFGNTLGIMIGVLAVVGAFLTLTGKIQLKKVMPKF